MQEKYTPIKRVQIVWSPELLGWGLWSSEEEDYLCDVDGWERLFSSYEEAVEYVESILAIEVTA